MHSSLLSLSMCVYNADLQRNLRRNGKENEDEEENSLTELTVNYAHLSHIR